MKVSYRTIVAASVLLLTTAIVGACATSDTMTVPQFISAHPTATGDVVTVRGTLAQRINDRAILVGNERAAILVYSPEGPFLGFEGVAGQEVVVTGTTRMIRADDPTLDWVGAPPDAIYVNRPGIVATNVQVVNR